MSGGGAEVIVGVDLKRGSPRSRTQPRYSVVLLRGEKLERVGELTLGELLSLVRRLGKACIAVDNLYELVPDRRSLERVLSSLPETIRIVQVTGRPGRAMPLKLLAKKAGIWRGGHPSPEESAELAAKLAQMGYGVELVKFEPEYRIVIAKNRSVRQGGSGSDRWRRSLEAAILSETNRIARALSEANIDYDLYVERGSGGLKRAEFIVYAEREEFRDIVREHEWGPVKIKIEPSWRRKVEFTESEEDEPRARPILVGIDPGMTVGLAIMDVRGRILEVRAMRRASKSEIIAAIVKHGYPVVVTTDASPPPKSVVRIAQIFGAKLIVFKTPMRVEEKSKIVSEIEEREGIRLSSSHERDALAPLIKVYNKKYKALFSRADARVRELGLQVDRERLYELLIKGYTIAEAIDMVTSHEVREEEEREVRPRPALRRLVRRLMKRVRELEEEVAALRGALQEREIELEHMRRELESIRERRVREFERDRVIAQKERRIKQLEERIRAEEVKVELLSAELRRLASADSEEKGWVRVKVLPRITREAVEEAITRGWLSEGDVLLTLDASPAGPKTAKLLADAGVAAVVYRTKAPPPDALEALIGEGVAVIDGRGIEVRWLGVWPYVREEVLAEAAWRAGLLRRSREEKDERELSIEEIISEYRRTLTEAPENL